MTLSEEIGEHCATVHANTQMLDAALLQVLLPTACLMS